MKLLLAKISLLTGARLLGTGFAFVTAWLVTQTFGAEGLATYGTAFAAASVLAVVMLCGFHAFAPVLTARYHAVGAYDLIHGLVRSAWSLVGVTTAIFAGLAALFLVVAPDQLDALAGSLLAGASADYAGAMLVFVAVTAPAFALSMFHGGVLAGLQRQSQAQLPDSLARPILIVAGVGLVALLMPDASLSTVLAIIAAASWTMALVQFWFLSAALRDYPSDAPRRDRVVWRGMAPSWMTIALIWDFGTDLFLLIAALLASAPEVALLYVCFRYRMLAGFGMRAIYSVLQPKIHAAMAISDAGATRTSIAMINATSMAYAVAVFVGLWLLGPWLLGLFGTDFAGGGAVLLIVSASFAARALFGPSLALLSARDRHASIAAILLATLILAIIGAWIFYPAYGLVALATAYTAANTLTAVTLWWLARKITGVDTGFWTLFGGSGRALAVPFG